jgi:dTDP-4-dehydrorhamnose 3,5-epimerase
MKILPTPIKDLIILEPRVFEDERGYFFESYNTNTLSDLGFNHRFIQDNVSKSIKGVIRGLHFQKGAYAQGKLVQVLSGAVLDVAVDLRSDSKTYGQHFSVELNDQNKRLFYIPEGFAHGFLTLTDNTIFSYKCTNLYNKESEGGLMWNDPSLCIDWGIDDPILSEKDLEYIDFNNFKTPF